LLQLPNSTSSSSSSNSDNVLTTRPRGANAKALVQRMVQQSFHAQQQQQQLQLPQLEETCNPQPLDLCDGVTAFTAATDQWCSSFPAVPDIDTSCLLPSNARVSRGSSKSSLQNRVLEDPCPHAWSPKVFCPSVPMKTVAAVPTTVSF